MGKGRTPRRPAMLEASVLETIYRNRGYTFRMMTPFGPEQWAVYDDGPLEDVSRISRPGDGKPRRARKPRPPRLIGYIRLRYGYLTVDRAEGRDEWRMTLGEEVYAATIAGGDPCFMDWNVRVHYLSNALMTLCGIKSPLLDYPADGGGGGNA